MARIISSVAGTRIEPKDSYIFIRGSTVTFKITFTNEGMSTQVDTSTVPVATIFVPSFLRDSNVPIPQTIATVNGTLTAGQEFEYSFSWDVPVNQTPSDEYVISYTGTLGGFQYNFGDEFFSIVGSAGTVGTRQPSYATVDDVRKMKFNIDEFLPEIFKKDLDTRNNLINDHLGWAAIRLREELTLYGQRGNTENYRLFCIYYTVWSIMLASRGQDGSSVSDENLNFYRSEYERILAQVKRKSGNISSISFGRG